MFILLLCDAQAAARAARITEEDEKALRVDTQVLEDQALQKPNPEGLRQVQVSLCFLPTWTQTRRGLSTQT